MHRLAQYTLVRLTALAAAMAFAILPAELLANCGCDDCGCPASTGDAAGCCCASTAMQAADCCHALQASPALPAVLQSGCNCQQTVPLQPTGIRVSSEDARSNESRRGEPVFLPALPAQGDIERTLGPIGLLSAANQRAFAAVPVRVMFCVWRN